MKTTCVQAALLLVAAVATVSALSIENEQPVKVTHRNSGPRYDIGEVERARALLREAAASSTPATTTTSSTTSEGQEEPTVGHIALRRIFLFPIMRPQGEEQQPGSTGGREQEDSSEQSPRAPMMIAKPLWPFMMPARPTPGQTGQPSASDEHDERPHIMRHLFGADEASRSPDMARAAAGEHDERRLQPMPPHAFDPIQMMMDMMHQAISGQLGRELAKDLNKEETEGKPSGGGDNAPSESSDERPTMPQVLAMKPGSQNETREDIVEIEGRKYVRKTLINRHVGDNLVFMTRRLIFIPLNETGEPTETTTTTTTELPPSSSSAQPGETDERPSPPAGQRAGEDKPKSEAPESLPTEQPSSTARPEEADATSPKPAEPTTTASPSEPAKSEASPAAADSKAAERLIEASEPSPKPEAEKEKETPKSSP